MSALVAACSPGMLAEPPGSPSDLSNSTALDERAALGVELAYSAARTAVEIGVDAGLIKGETATRVANLDELAYQSVLGARAAYEAGQADSYAEALIRARDAVSRLLDVVKGRTSPTAAITAEQALDLASLEPRAVS